MTLLAVRRFEIPEVIARESIAIMQQAGEEGAEVFVAWAGAAASASFVFSRLIVPEQTSYRTPAGLLVRIPGRALFELNRSCHRYGEMLGGQIHAHPGAAYHSAADDSLALVRTPGGVSVVVPDFARGGLARRDAWACFQLDGAGAWGDLPAGVEVTIT